MDDFPAQSQVQWITREAAERFAPAVIGPRTWWNGALPVESLAIRSASAALTAAHAFLGERRFALDTRRLAGAFASIRHLRVDGAAPEPYDAASGFFQCRDGWVRTHANYPHHRDALAGALGLGELAAALRERAAADVEELAFATGGLAVRVRGRAEWRATLPAEGRAGAAGPETPWIALHPRTGSPRAVDRPAGDRRDAGSRLAGLRVLDLTRVIAGPTGTKFLAALGADVLRVDPPHRPELLTQHLDTDDGKRSAEADLREADALNRVRALATEADVVLTGYRPGALARFGLDAAAPLETRPGLAVVELDAWGGCPEPWRGRRGFDSLVQAASGIADLYGTAAGDEEAARDDTVTGHGTSMRDEAWNPGALPVQALDHATGYGAAAAALTLLPTGGSARLSLARTAEELFSLPPLRPGPGPAGEAAPELVEVGSPHGRLTRVAPLIGEPRAPGRYGADVLTWV
ncbi:CoA transferase [Rothia sp. AR01]|uniref:CoA transferase n=1 Tax=Rothia santali TaxID=2949643 RepID=A0A9X2KIA3_9MICC|nr:CoA transferase [Rothia santali]MCP3426697.1 CoA transferase [Rothia santali]